MTIQELIDIIDRTLKKDERIKLWHKFQADTALQIQLESGENFNIRVVKLNNKDHIIKRY